MKTNKVFKWLYGVFMFLPMLAIGVTCAYVTFNKNAYQSYSDNEPTQTYINNTNELVTNGIYYIDTRISNIQAQTNAIGSYNQRLYFETIETDNNTLQNASSIGFYQNANSTSISYQIYDDSNNVLITNNTTTNYHLKIKYSSNNINTYFFTYDFIYKLEQTNYLDNAFYYAVDQFNESGFNKVDFVSYFDMFYNNTSIWTTFANTYMNYVLFVSLAFFIPRILFWFINFAFSLVDGFSNKYKEW